MQLSEIISVVFGKCLNICHLVSSKLKNSDNKLENVVGILILLFASFFIYWAISVSSVNSLRGYTLYSVFSNTSGIVSGSDVRLKGVKIGSVKDIRLNPSNYMVEIRMEINKNYKLPSDTTAKIVSDGFIGDKYIMLNVGTASKYLKHRDAIKGTSAKSIEEIISQVLFSSDK